FVFFFQAEDGIRDFHVTGVQTCALPIFLLDLHGAGARIVDRVAAALEAGWALEATAADGIVEAAAGAVVWPGGFPHHVGPGESRSEERRVGKECRERWGRWRVRERERGR